MVQGNQENGMKCIKYMLLSVIAISVITSILIISVGSTIYAIYSDLLFFLSDEFFSPVTFIIVIGVIMLFVSLFSCIGALKESTFLLNIVISILIIVLGISVYTHYKILSSFYPYSTNFFTHSDKRLRNYLGMVLLIVTLFGFFGSLKQSTCMVNLFALFLTLILMFRLVVVLNFFVELEMVGDMVVVPIWMYKWKPEESQRPLELDQLQIKFNCCGIQSYLDYAKVDIHTNSTVVYSEDGSLSLVLPQSCCTRSSEGICRNIRTSGCQVVLTELVVQNAKVLGVLGVSVMFVQVLVIIFAQLLARCFRKLKAEKALLLQTIKEQIKLAQQMEDSHKNENSSVFIITRDSSTA